MSVFDERGVVVAGEEAVDVGLGATVFVAVTGVAEEAVVAVAFQVAVFDAEECHREFVVITAFFFSAAVGRWACWVSARWRIWW